MAEKKWPLVRVEHVPEGMRVKLRAKGLEFAGIQGPKARFIPAQGNALGKGVTINIEG